MLQTRVKWEMIDEIHKTGPSEEVQGHYVTKRLKVPGGYLYRFTSVHSSATDILGSTTTMTFVPEPTQRKRK